MSVINSAESPCRSTSWRQTRSSTSSEMVQRPMRVRRRMPSRRCSARSSSPSFLAAQTNIAKTTPALSSATTESKTPSATVTGQIVPGSGISAHELAVEADQSRAASPVS